MARAGLGVGTLGRFAARVRGLMARLLSTLGRMVLLPWQLLSRVVVVCKRALWRVVLRPVRAVGRTLSRPLVWLVRPGARLLGARRPRATAVKRRTRLRARGRGRTAATRAAPAGPGSETSAATTDPVPGRLARRRFARLLELALRRTTAAVVAVALGAMVVAVRGQEPPVPYVDLDNASTLAVAVPASVALGQRFTIAVRDPRGRSGPVEVDLLGDVGAVRLHGLLRRGSAEVAVPARAVVSVGSLVVVVSTRYGAAAVREVSVRPGRAAIGIVPLAGPHSIVADGLHWTKVSVIPVDVTGNGLADGTAVVVHARRPDGRRLEVRGTLKDLLAGIRVYSGTVAGPTTLRVEVQGAFGPEVQVDEVAGPPRPFKVVAPSAPLLADGRSLIAISTEELRDRYGNVLGDGISARLVTEGPDGRSEAVGTVIAGRAEFRITSPVRAGRMVGTVEVEGIRGAVELDVLPAIATLPVSVTRHGDAVRLRVGPLRTRLGGFVPDGTLVTVRLPDGSSRTVEVSAGYAAVDLVMPAGSSIGLRVLDATATAVAP